MATKRSVQRWAVAEMAPAPPMNTVGSRNGSSPPSTQSLRGVGEDLERVGVDGADGLLHPGDVGMAGELQHAGRAEVAAGADRDVVDDDRDRAGGRHRPEVGDDAGLGGPDVVRHHDEGGGEGGGARERLDRGDGLGGVVGAGADDELGRVLGADPGAGVDHGPLLGGVERRRLAGGAEGDDAGAPVVEVLVAEALDRVERDGTVGCERGDEGDVDALEQTACGHGREGTAPASARARRNTSSSIGSVRRPVNVFCWLGW